MGSSQLENDSPSSPLTRMKSHRRSVKLGDRQILYSFEILCVWGEEPFQVGDSLPGSSIQTAYSTLPETWRGWAVVVGRREIWTPAYPQRRISVLYVLTEFDRSCDSCSGTGRLGQRISESMTLIDLVCHCRIEKPNLGGVAPRSPLVASLRFLGNLTTVDVLKDARHAILVRGNEVEMWLPRNAFLRNGQLAGWFMKKPDARRLFGSGYREPGAPRLPPDRESSNDPF